MTAPEKKKEKEKDKGYDPVRLIYLLINNSRLQRSGRKIVRMSPEGYCYGLPFVNEGMVSCLGRSYGHGRRLATRG